MQRFVIPVVILLMLSICDSKASGVIDGIGVYYDEAGTINCLPDSMSFPYEIDAYLLIKNVSSVGGIAGWEGQLAGDSGLVLMPDSLYGGECINAAEFPEYSVGFVNPVPQDTAVVLAQFKILALSEGNIYFRGRDNPSLPGSAYPVYSRGDDIGSFIEMSYSYGGPDSCVATVGVYNCPEYIAAQQSSQEYTIHDWPVFDVGETEEVSMSTSRTIPDSISIDQYNQQIQRSEVSFLGEILDVEFSCVGLPGSRKGMAIVDFLVIENYWNAYQDTVTIYIDGITIPGCIVYRNYDPRPALEDFIVGDRYCILAFQRSGVLMVGSCGLMPAGGSKSVVSNCYRIKGSDPVREVARHSDSIGYGTQYSNADIVIIGRVVRAFGEYCLVRVYRSIKGDVSGELVVIRPHDKSRYRYLSAAPRIERDKVYLMILRDTGDGGYAPYAGKWSIIENRDGNLVPFGGSIRMRGNDESVFKKFRSGGS